MYKPILEKECPCFKCQSKKTIEEFLKEIKAASAEMGFVPRMYDPAFSFNTVPPKFKKVYDIPTDSILNALNNLKAVVSKNKTIVFKSNKTPVYCRDCGKLHIHNPNNRHEDGWICKTCFDARYILCHDCGSVTRRETLMKVNHPEIKYICRTCFNKSYKKCVRCGNVRLSSSFVTVKPTHLDSFEVCSSCATTIVPCDECGDLWFNDQLHHMGPARKLCAVCVEDEIPIKEYMHKPNPIFQFNRLIERTGNRHSLFMGVEYEVENNGPHDHYTAINRLKEIFGKRYFYCKKDSSINYGFEIVTHPFSFENFVARRKDWKDAIDSLTQLGFSNKARDPGWQKTVGIHIHLTKRAFNAVQLYKFLSFIYNKDNRNFLIDISERGKENFYAKFHPDANKLLCKISKHRTNFCKVTQEHADNHQNPGDVDKNIAVNLKPSSTVEVRIFASTMDPVAFMKNVEFCHALFVFSHDYSIKDMTVEKFLEFVFVKNPKTYKYLYTFIVSKMTAYLHKHHTPINYDFGKKGAI